MNAVATAPLIVDVPNHRRLAPVGPVLDTLDANGMQTADQIGTHLDLSTRDVVATLNLLRLVDSVYLIGPGHALVDAEFHSADLVVRQEPEGHGSVVKGWYGLPRRLSTAEMAVLAGHQPVRRIVPARGEGAGPAVWGLA